MLHNEPLERLPDGAITVDLLPRVTRVLDRHSDDVTDALLVQPVKKILHVFAAKRPNLAYSGSGFGFPLAVGLPALHDDFDARNRDVLQHTIKPQAGFCVCAEALEEILP
jgi:hypothetical protein